MMESYSKTFEAIWADIDMNGHMLHTRYNDYAAHARVGLFAEAGFPLEGLRAMNIGPILFREETKFKREVRLGDLIKVHVALRWMKIKGSRWSMLHEIYKNEDTKAAEIVVDGAWLDLDKRTLAVPPKELMDIARKFPKTDEFEWKE